MRVNKSTTLGFREAKTVRVLTQDQRFEWIRELLAGDRAVARTRYHAFTGA
jgi:hypothetical protein